MPAYALDSFGPEPAGPLATSGIRGVIRYLAPVNPLTAPKITTLTEVANDRNAGLDITLNWEWYEKRPLEGFLAGQQDAVSADAQADALGYPSTCAIYYSVDTGASWPQVEPYFRGIHAISKRPVGIYGGIPLWDEARNAGYVQYGWITNAASWSGFQNWGQVQQAAVDHGAHLLQHLHDGAVMVPGVNPSSFDANTILQDNYGQWSSKPEGIFMALSDQQQAQMFFHVIELYELVFANTGHGPAHDQSMLHDIESSERTTQAMIGKLPAAGVSGTIDVSALAKAVADEIHNRLTS